MNRTKPPPHDPSRRNALKAAGALVFLSCGATGTDTTGGTSADGGTILAAADGGIVTLAVGSGAFLADKTYANPFASGVGSSCVASKTATAGPCHSNTYNRKDVSDGLIGLPTRLELLVVDTACTPVSNAIVEIWYASPAGTYSAAQTAEAGGSPRGSYADLNVGFCTGNAAAALSSNWLRGYQTSGADGRVTFDGIYPGWYASRTTHIHFKVTVGTSDKVVSESGLTLSKVVLSYDVQSDGAVVLSKAITLA